MKINNKLAGEASSPETPDTTQMKPHTSAEMEVGHLQTVQAQSELRNNYKLHCLKKTFYFDIAGAESSSSTDGTSNAKPALLKSEIIFFRLLKHQN